MRTAPNQLALFKVFVDGTGYAGKADIQLPDIEHNTEDFDTGVGIIKQLMSLNALESTITMHGIEPTMDKHLVMSTHGAKRITLRGSVDGHDGKVPIKVSLEGVFTRMGGANVERGAQKLQREYVANPRVYKYEYNGEVIHNIDLDNAVVIVGGEDLMAPHRSNAGF